MPLSKISKLFFMSIKKIRKPKMKHQIKKKNKPNPPTTTLLKDVMMEHPMWRRCN